MAPDPIDAAQGMAEMRAILGDSVPASTCRAYLQETRGDVALAINRFLDGGTRTSSSSSSEPASVNFAAHFGMRLVQATAERGSSSTSANRRSVPVAGSPARKTVRAPAASPAAQVWPRRLGTFRATGVCLSKLRGDELQAGQRLLVKRAQPAAADKPKAGKGKSSGRGSAGRGRGASPNSAKVNTVVRLCTEDGAEVGRLGAELADCIAPLLDEEKLTLEVFCSAAVVGRGYRISDLLPIQVVVALSAAAFTSAASAAAASDAEANSTAFTNRRFALSRLVQRLGMVALVPPLVGRGSLGEGSNAAPTALPTAAPGTAADADGAALPDEAPLLDLTAEGGAEEGLIGELVRGGSTRNFEVPQPRFLACSLRPYQREALGWMLWRELSEREREAYDGARAGNGASVRTIHPAWAMYAFEEDHTGGGLGRGGGSEGGRAAADASPGGKGQRGGVFYVNPTSGAVSLSEPTSDAAPRGGILADEMGLGKTVEIIALILADMEGATPWAVFTKEEEEGKVVGNASGSHGVPMVEGSPDARGSSRQGARGEEGPRASGVGAGEANSGVAPMACCDSPGGVAGAPDHSDPASGRVADGYASEEGEEEAGEGAGEEAWKEEEAAEGMGEETEEEAEAPRSGGSGGACPARVGAKRKSRNTDDALLAEKDTAGGEDLAMEGTAVAKRKSREAYNARSAPPPSAPPSPPGSPPKDTAGEDSAGEDPVWDPVGGDTAGGGSTAMGEDTAGEETTEEEDSVEGGAEAVGPVAAVPKAEAAAHGAQQGTGHQLGARRSRRLPSAATEDDMSTSERHLPTPRQCGHSPQRHTAVGTAAPTTTATGNTVLQRVNPTQTGAAAEASTSPGAPSAAAGKAGEDTTGGRAAGVDTAGENAAEENTAGVAVAATAAPVDEPQGSVPAVVVAQTATSAGEDSAGAAVAAAAAPVGESQGSVPAVAVAQAATPQSRASSRPRRATKSVVYVGADSSDAGETTEEEAEEAGAKAGEEEAEAEDEEDDDDDDFEEERRGHPR